MTDELRNREGLDTANGKIARREVKSGSGIWQVLGRVTGQNRRLCAGKALSPRGPTRSVNHGLVGSKSVSPCSGVPVPSPVPVL